MQTILWLIPLLPIAGFLALSAFGRRSGKTIVAMIGAGTVGSAAVLALIAGTWLETTHPAGDAIVSSIGSWIKTSGISVSFSLKVDPLSDIMMLVITFVGFLIHLYSTAFMRGKGDYHRYFAYLNLFVGAMLLLVLANNLLLLFIGWEGVGLCSYLLIGFWYENPENGKAANKAFIVTRIADAALLVGLFLTLSTFGTLNIPRVLSAASSSGGGAAITAIASLLLVGALGKSAQLPFQLWLPDAMAGPTPVSALIHAATMVTAGVYLVARMHVLFLLSPAVQLAVAIIGAATLLYGGLCALGQYDIKRVLAYSTISQIGYMFLGLGVGAWSASIFHFMAHAFFKALLFLAAGVIIHRLSNEHDIFKMGGFRRSDPLLFWVFLVGAAALSGIPLITSGFYSKEAILEAAWGFPSAGPLFWLVGAVGVFLTGAYVFRAFFNVFLGEPSPDRPDVQPTLRMFYPPMILLAVGAILIGFLKTPRDLGHATAISAFLKPVLPAEHPVHEGLSTEVVLQIIVSVFSLLGVAAAYLGYRRTRREERVPTGLHAGETSLSVIGRFLHAGMGADGVAGLLIVKPFLWLAGAVRRDWVTVFYDGVGKVGILIHRVLSRTQSGLIRWYLAGLAVGVVVLLGLVVFV